MKTMGYAAKNSTTDLSSFDFERRELGATDVLITITYCGVCHSDIHFARNDWGWSAYPVVPGHEIIGKVEGVGEKVSTYKKGDIVGVGCMVDSCRTCPACKNHLEQYCEKGMVMTYGSPDFVMGGVTHGGYSDKIVVDEKFVLRVSDKLDLKSVAPLLCAGITTYSPLHHWKVKKGDKVGIIGLGGLGHLAVKIAAAMGAYVVVITTSPDKEANAKMLGAQTVLVSKDERAMASEANSFDFLLNTIPVPHDINPYIRLMKRDTTMVIVGVIGMLPKVSAVDLITKRKCIAGSLIGGLKETQEMLDFCAEHQIVSDIELINIQDINTAFERVIKGDVKYRFVIDMASLSKE